jgi:competence protein ComEA
VRALLEATHSELPDERWLPPVDPDDVVPRPAEPVDHVPAPARAALPLGGVSSWLARRGVRLDPGLRGAAAIGCAVLIVALVVGWWVLSNRPHAVTVSSSSPSVTALSTASASATAPLSAGPTAVPVVVDVVGKVRHPGVFRLPAGSRIDDALRAAGGALRGVDMTTLNLARKVTDGEQIAVGVNGATETAPAASGAVRTPASSGPVDLNTAGAEQLDALPGVGPVLAQRIVEWRTAHGRFDSIDQLREVSGIGDSKFNDLRPLVTV